MTMDFPLDMRKRKILRAVVQSYILSGKPVGSTRVAQIAGLKISPATVRNEMATMEDLGLLMQPYTSAGRIPTDLAYRYYVDMLMGHPEPSSRDAQAVEKLFEARTREIEGLFHEASVLLSRLTRTTAVVFAPFCTVNSVHHIDLVRLAPRQVVMVVITTGGEVARRLLNLRVEVRKDTVERVDSYLKRVLSGRSIEDIDIEDLVAGAGFSKGGSGLLQTALEGVVDTLSTVDERVFVGGTANIVREMASEGGEWVQLLLEALEKQYFILDLLKDVLQERRLTVLIGEENRLAELQRCSFVGMSYPMGTGLTGSLGVVGPTSMDYARAIGMVELMADSIGRRFSEEE